MSSTAAKEIGEELEFTIASGDPDLELVGDGEEDWFDARDQDGRPVEIKTCAFRISDGASSSRGRLLIKRRAHERLLEEEGHYRIGVYGDDREVLVEKEVSASVVDEAISSWIDTDGRSYEFAQVRWSALIPTGAVE